MKIRSTLLGVPLLLAAMGCGAAPYPEKQIRLIVPAAAGGAADTLARILAQGLDKQLGQSVFVENRSGAAAIIGMSAIAKAPHDGYTLGLVFSGGMSINPTLYKELPYSPSKDFAPVSLIAISPLIIAASPKLGVKSLSDLTELAKKSPGTLTFGSTGTGSTQHLSMELFKSVAHVDMLHVPYKGSAAAIMDTQSGLISVVSDNAITLAPFIQAGQLTPLAVGTVKRLQSMPGLPTVAESGFPSYSAAGWYGLVAPAGTPQAIIQKLNAAINALIGDKEISARLKEQGMEPQPDTPAEFKTFMQGEEKKWAEVINNARIPKQGT